MMTINEIISNIDVISVKRSSSEQSKSIASLCQDSRAADCDCLFFCKVGAVTDGHRYARSAYDKGARVFVVEREVELPEDATLIFVRR